MVKIGVKVIHKKIVKNGWQYAVDKKHIRSTEVAYEHIHIRSNQYMHSTQIKFYDKTAVKVICIKIEIHCKTVKCILSWV